MALLLFVVALMLPALALRSREEPTANPESSVLVQPAEAASAAGPVVRVGLQVRNIYDLSLVGQSFLAEGWYWLDWGDDVEAILKRKGVDPEHIIEFANEIELGQYFYREVTPGSGARPGSGRHGLTVRFSGKFYIQDVPQRYAPFDPQRLAIQLEVKAESLGKGPDRLRLEPATSAAHIIGEQIDLSGYELKSVAWQRNVVTYPDDFLPGMRFSRLSAVFVYDKSDWAMFMKWVFPVLIVMAIVIVSPSIEGVLGDIRLAIPPSALLTLVVMQDTYKNSFPPAPYLTYLDELYVYSYIVCLAIFLLFLVGTNRVSLAAEGERGTVMRRVNRMDTVVQLALVFGFFCVLVVGWFT